MIHKRDVIKKIIPTKSLSQGMIGFELAISSYILKMLTSSCKA